MANRALAAIFSELWAIDPGYLPLLAALAQRNHGAPEVQAADGWVKRDFQMMAGPTATKLDGAARAYVVDGVAVISVVGPIFPRANLMTEMSGATAVSTLQNDLRAALESDNVQAVMFLFDTPGGAVSGINAAADQIFAARGKKPMAAHVSGSSASAGYWLATQVGEITMERTGIVGSIGVVAAMPKQVQPDSEGYVTVEVVSSNAPNKRVDPTTEDGLDQVRTTLDAIEREFVADVARGRGVSAKTVLADYGQGGVKVGSDAVTAGMADRISSFDASMKKLAQIARAQQRVAALKK